LKTAHKKAKLNTSLEKERVLNEHIRIRQGEAKATLAKLEPGNRLSLFRSRQMQGAPGICSEGVLNTYVEQISEEQRSRWGLIKRRNKSS